MTSHRVPRIPDERLKVLVAVDIPSPEQLSPLLIQLHRPLSVCLLGVFMVPEQTAPEQAREQFAEEAGEALEEVADAFEEAGVQVETRLVFSSDRLDTVERTAIAEECHAILLAKPVYSLERILVALRPGPLATRITHLLTELLAHTDCGATLLYVVEDEEEADEARGELELLQRELLATEDVREQQIEIRLEIEADPNEAVASAVRDHDLVVIGETEPSVREAVFGDFSRRLADETETPVMVVRREL